MSFTSGVRGTGEVLGSLFVDFQVICNVFAVWPIANNQSVRWMDKAEELHKTSSDAIS
jgi:hypothetical protein